MQSKIFLVTGGTGFVGRRLCSAISAAGGNLHLLIRRYYEPIDCDQFICDFSRDTIPETAFEAVDTVFHLAGYAHDLGNSSGIEYLYQEINVDATVQLAELAVKHGVKNFIYVSSSKAGGSAIQGLCSSELDQRDPEGIYGQTKRTAELRLLEIGQKSGMKVSIVRPTLVYGAGVKGNLRMMLSGIDNGWFPPLPETNNRRSMIHVDDLVRVMLLLSKDDRANGEIFIASDGRDYSSRELYKAMCQASGKKVPRWWLPVFLLKLVAKSGDALNGTIPFPFDSYRYGKLLGDECFSSEKLRTVLGFEPKYSIYDALPGMVLALRDES